MSGDLPIVALPGAAATALVASLTTVADAGLGRWALVGGLAVHVRLGSVHRATLDIDAVIDNTVPPDYLQALTSLPSVRAVDDTTVRVGDVTVEILPAAPAQPDDLAAVPDLLNRLFVGGLTWALDTAAPVRVSAVLPPGPAVIVPVATPGALVAMKLHAVLDRRGPGLVKRASDGLDLYQLLLTQGEVVAIQLTGAPEPLRSDVTRTVRDVLVEGSRRTSGWMRQGSGPGATAAELRFLGEDLLRRMT